MRHWRHRLLPVAVGLASLALLAAVVELMVRSSLINPFIMPTPSSVFGSFGRLIGEEHGLARLGATAAEVLAASVLITVVGVPVALLLHWRVRLRAAFESWVAALAAAPLVLAYPLFLVLFGRSQLTIVVMAFAAGVAPVILKTVEGFAGVRPVLVDVGRSLRLTPSQLFWKILLPAAIPSIFVGLRLGLIFALLTVTGVEFLINIGGLGHLINELAERYDMPGTYAAITFVVLVSVIFFAILESGERWLARSAR